LKIKKLLILNRIHDIDQIKSIIKENEIEIYSLNFSVHSVLNENKIPHVMSEELLAEDDLNKIFDKTVELYDWHNNIEKNKITTSEDVNVCALMDTGEFHDLVFNHLYEFLMIKKIITKQATANIIANSSIIEIIRLFDNNLSLEPLDNDLTDDKLFFDNIQIKFNLGKTPRAFSLSRNFYNKSKIVYENIICAMNDLWFKGSSRNIVLLLEFNPAQFENLFLEFKKKNLDIVVFNRRRSVVWNRKSISILKKYDVKVLNFEKIASKKGKKWLNTDAEKVIHEIHDMFTNKIFYEIFSFDNVSFWLPIKKKLERAISDRIIEYMSLIHVTKELFAHSNVKCILSLNVVGETEKTALALKPPQTVSIMLEHAFANYLPEFSRYDILSMYSLFPEKIAVWGPIQKKYLLEQCNIDEERIIECGSPKHDLFKQDYKFETKTPKTILLCPRPIISNTGHKDSVLYEKYYDLLKKLINFLNKNNHFEVLVKMHPAQIPHNQLIIKKIQELAPAVKIYQSKPIQELIKISDLVVNISPEGYDPSTIMLETMLLRKPIMNIILDEKIFDFEFQKQNAIIGLRSSEDFKPIIKKILYDPIFQKQILKNEQIFINKYLMNFGNASSFLAQYIQNL